MFLKDLVGNLYLLHVPRRIKIQKFFASLPMLLFCCFNQELLSAKAVIEKNRRESWRDLIEIIFERNPQWSYKKLVSKSSGVTMYSDEKSVIGNANKNDIHSVLFMALISFHLKCFTESFIVSHLEVLDKLQHTHTHMRCWCAQSLTLHLWYIRNSIVLQCSCSFSFAIVAVLQLYR